MKNINEIISELAVIDSGAWENQLTIPAVEVRSKTGEAVISGNKAGLQHLALQLLKISDSNVVGAHYHLDEVSIADLAETNVIFTLRNLHAG